MFWKHVRQPALLLCLILLLTACGAPASPSESTAEDAPGTGGTAQEEVPAGSLSEPQNPGAYTTAYTYALEDTDSAWNSGNATLIDFEGGTAKVSGGGAAFSGDSLTIGKSGTYVLSGTLEKGQVRIDAGKEDVVRLVLNGVSLHNDNGPAIYAEKGQKLVLILAEGTQNTVSDGGSYALSGEEDPDAAIYAKNDLSICGEGELRVTGDYKHGIRTQDILAISGGTIHVTAAGDALRGRDGVVCQGGSLYLNAGSDGIQANNDTDDARGYVLITGGSFDITAGNDAIQACTSLRVQGGSFRIQTGGGSAAAPVRESESFGGRGGAVQATTEETESKKGLKAGKLLMIDGGSFTVDAEDDAIHANGDVLITEGELSLQSGDDGIHADSSVTISGGRLSIPVCYEGIEGLSVTIHGGDITIVASDDAFNAADGEAAEMGGRGGGMWPQNGEGMEGTLPEGWDGQEMEGIFPGEWPQGEGGEGLPPGRIRGEGEGAQPERPQGGEGAEAGFPQGGMGGNQAEPKFSVTEGAFIRITGGTIDIQGKTDGVDSNGHIYLEGGTLKINAQSMGAEGALDMEGNLVVTGGELITAGSIYTPSGESTQPVILLSYTAQQPAGTVISIRDADGNSLLEMTSKLAFSASGFTSPSFQIGKTYSLFINGEERLAISLEEQSTKIGDDGGAYNVGGGNWGGGNRGNRGGG